MKNQNLKQMTITALANQRVSSPSTNQNQIIKEYHKTGGTIMQH
jgi:hypothetical protein